MKKERVRLHWIRRGNQAIGVLFIGLLGEIVLTWDVRPTNEETEEALNRAGYISLLSKGHNIN